MPQISSLWVNYQKIQPFDNKNAKKMQKKVTNPKK